MEITQGLVFEVRSTGYGGNIVISGDISYICVLMARLTGATIAASVGFLANISTITRSFSARPNVIRRREAQIRGQQR